MPVQQFTRQQFEAALPKHKSTSVPLWVHLGIQSDEHCYLIPVGSYGAAIMIRSSIDSTGMSASAGEDSIRAYIVKASKYLDYKQNEQWDISPLGPKTQRWITRVNGWEKRLDTVLRLLYKLALCTRPCKKCGDLQAIVKVKRGDNAGKFAVCCRKACGEFYVLSIAA